MLAAAAVATLDERAGSGTLRRFAPNADYALWLVGRFSGGHGDPIVLFCAPKAHPP
jgi:hypothetical protein